MSLSQRRNGAPWITGNNVVEIARQLLSFSRVVDISEQTRSKLGECRSSWCGLVVVVMIVIKGGRRQRSIFFFSSRPIEQCYQFIPTEISGGTFEPCWLRLWWWDGIEISTVIPRQINKRLMNRRHHSSHSSFVIRWDDRVDSFLRNPSFLTIFPEEWKSWAGTGLGFVLSWRSVSCFPFFTVCALGPLKQLQESHLKTFNLCLRQIYVHHLLGYWVWGNVSLACTNHWVLATGKGSIYFQF